MNARRGPARALAVAVAMEPVAAAVHRLFGHGIGWALHRDHHENVERSGSSTTGWHGLERNDLIPATLAAATMAAFARSVASPRHRARFWTALGVAGYGLAYTAVHDIYIHRRLPLLPERIGWLEAHRRAHERHHCRGGPPYGMLAPVARR